MNNQKNVKYTKINTIDEKHTEMVNRFMDIEVHKIPELQLELKQIKRTLKTCDGISIEKIMDLQDSYKKIIL
jgi:hypothetical protein